MKTPEEIKAYQKEYRSKNKDKIKQQTKAWRESHKEYVKQYKNSYNKLPHIKAKNQSRYHTYYLSHKEKELNKSSEYYKAHKEIRLKLSSINHYKNRDKINLRHQSRQIAIRKTFLKMYGNKCACCGESNYEFLTIEHIKGQAGKKKEGSYRAYTNAIKNYRPDIYEILCMNCNHSRGRYGYCPHHPPT